MSLLLLFCSHWPGLQKHDFIEHFLRQYFQKCHYSARELAFSVPRCHPNNTVSEEVKLVEIASRVMKDRFASSVNNSDLWNDDLTKRVSLLLLIRILCSAQWSCQDPDGKWEWWWKAPVLFLILLICECSFLHCSREKSGCDGPLFISSCCWEILLWARVLLTLQFNLKLFKEAWLGNGERVRAHIQ